MKNTVSVVVPFEASCRTGDTLEHRSDERIATLLENAIAAGESLLNTAKERNWGNDQDVQALRGEIGAAAALLRSGQ